MLSTHPEVFMTDIKEPRFFCTDLHRESDEFHKTKKYFSIRTIEQYAKLFGSVTNEKIIGESSADYLYSQRAPGNIYNFNPDARIIIMLREPISQMKSLFLELYSGFRGDDAKTLEKALELEPYRKQGLHVPQTARMPSSLFYRENAHYLKFIKGYLDIFPKENVHFIVLENLIENPSKVRRELFGFLQVKAMEIPLEIKNVKYSKLYLRNKRLSVSLIHFFKPYKRIIPKPILQTLRNMIQISDIDSMVKINEKLEEELKTEFKLEVRALSGITGLGLEKIWNYH